MKYFYEQLNPIRDFLSFSDQTFYTPIPEDWILVITDVVGSTKAIDEGKYKWVNMAGASSVVALTNALGNRNFPFVFGGDGATALIPESSRHEAEKYLRSARTNAKVAFGLQLRIGMISQRDLNSAGTPVEVARFNLPSGLSIAFFRGEGVNLAEEWVKGGKGLIEDGPEVEADVALSGLSCRWAPLKSEKGFMLSIIVKARANDQQAETILRRIAEKIDALVDLDAPSTHPVKLESLTPASLFETANKEATLRSIQPHWFGVVKIMSEMLLVRIFDRFNLKLPNIDIRKYKTSMVSHSDYRKFDEQLRLVIDCTKEAAEDIRKALETEKQAGTIYFGIHESDSALLTCFLQSFEELGHIHFVDGNDGGYAMAARELKTQIKETKVVALQRTPLPN